MKNFAGWFGLKPKLDNLSKFPVFREGEIWWCHLGENVGHEENGRGDKFLRPVIIIKKFNQRLFYGLPTSSIVKSNKYYYSLTIKNKTISVLLSQMRAIDAKRLSYKQTKLSETELKLLQKEVSMMFLGKN